MSQNTPLLVVGIIIVILITAGLTYYVAKSGSQPPSNLTNGTGSDGPTITVRGEAAKTLSPDQLTIGIRLESFGNDTQSSQAQSSIDTAALKAALLGMGLNSSEIQTSSYYTYAVYNESCNDYCYPYYYPADDVVYEKGASEPSATTPMMGEGVAYADSMMAYPMPPCRSEEKCNIIGYRTVHSVLVKSAKTDQGGDMISAAANATNSMKIDYIYFSISEETRLRLESELQTEAAKSAKAKAESIAKGLGADLGKIVSINPDYYYPYPVYAYRDEAMGGTSSSPEAPPTEIFPTDTTMSSYITVVYALEQ